MRSVDAARLPSGRFDRIFRKLVLLNDETSVQSMTRRLVKVSRPTILGFVNAHAVNICWQDSRAASWFSSCDVLLRDGVGMKWFCHLLGLQPGLNMNGTDFIPAFLKSCQTRSLAVFGTRNPYLDAGVERLRANGHEIVHVEDGFKSDAHYLGLLRQKPASVVILAMGMPRQEQCALYLKQHLRHPCIIICGGAVIDFIGGKVRRAPPFLRSVGMEWMYRLVCEPRRMFSRYITGGALFGWRLLALRAGNYRPPAFSMAGSPLDSSRHQGWNT